MKIYVYPLASTLHNIESSKLFSSTRSSFIASHNVNSLYNKEKFTFCNLEFCLSERKILLGGCRWWWIWWRQKVFPSFRGNLFPLQIEIFSRFNFHSPKKVLKSHVVLRRTTIFSWNIFKARKYPAPCYKLWS
jgi:hypothetical protein